MKNRILFFLFLLWLLPTMSVSAKDSIIKNITIKETSEDVYYEEPLVEDNVLTPVIGFKNVGSFVSYQIELDYDTYLYNIDFITDNNRNSYFKTIYDHQDNKIFMTILYDKPLLSNFAFANYDIDIKLVEKNINPKTSNNLGFLVLIVIYSSLALYSIITRKKVILISSFAIIMLFPVMVFAIDSHYKIKVDTSNIGMGYKVQFNASGATGEVSSIVCMKGKECSLPENEFQNNGLLFMGWSTSLGGPVVFTDQQKVFDINENDEEEITLYAVWKRQYTVHFDGNGSTSGNMSDITCIEDQECNLTTNAYQKTNYIYRGWATSSSGSVTYQNEASPVNITSQNEITLYAIWRLQYTIQFNGNGSTSGSMSDITCIEDESCTLTSNSYQKSGYSFKGWATSSTGSVSFNNGATYMYMTTNPQLTLYAVWAAEYYFTATGNVQSFVTPYAGRYQFEVWGAQGGTASSRAGGNGGYSVGTVTLPANTILYVYVGKQGTTGSSSGTSGGFNGGGNATGTGGAGGGGATDIRIGTDSLYARVIVAGGGGGSGQDSCAYGNTGYGGGTSGGGGGSQGSCGTQAYGGSQTSGGSGGYYSGTTGASGSFGIGGNAADNSYDGGGGGGGWYGGGAGASAGWSNAGGGGSGYVYTSSTASSYPSGCLLNSSYYLSNAATYSGNTTIPTTSSGTETGHSGNGYARISYLGA